MIDIPLHKVESSNLAAIGYDATTRTLRVKFQDGRAYDHHDVSEGEYTEFDKAESKGRHYADRFRNKNYQKVPT